MAFVKGAIHQVLKQIASAASCAVSLLSSNLKRVLNSGTA
jgi:hypothetical protein